MVTKLGQHFEPFAGRVCDTRAIKHLHQLIVTLFRPTQVTSIQFASLLVPILLSVLANAYTHHDDKYYDEQVHHPEDNEIEDDHDPSYRYEYQVNSPHTGDYKTQHEERIGDTVRGHYSLIEPDGMRRIVEYTADPLHGFRAVVKREPTTAHVHQRHVQPAPVPTPLGHARPIPTKLPEPVTTKYPKKLFYSAPQSYYFQTSKSPTPSPKYFPFLRYQRWPFSY